MGPFEMVVAIVLIATIGKVVSSRHKAKHGIIEDKDMNGNVQLRLASDPESARLREEINQLKDRIQVLERIATDNSSTNDLNRQIEELRGR
jgi:thiamine biosynthesis lipoprotein ApbE